ncbi:MAG: CPBP family glutamic-type intramembrane protease [Actinomycetota bacterium]
MAEEGGESAGAGRDLPRCSWHNTEPATAMCVSCARPVCRECDRFLAFRHYCPECAPYVPAPYAYPYPVPPPIPYQPAAYPYPYPYPVPPPAPYQPAEPGDERERRWWRADWGLLEVFVAFLVIFGLYNLVGIVLYVFTEDSLFFNYLAYALVFCPLIAASIWFVLRRHGRGRDELGLRWGNPKRTLAFGTVGSLVALASSYGAFFLVYFIFYLLAGRAPVSGETERLQDLGGGYLVLVIVVVVVLAPVFEELFFRGLFYPALRRRLGPTAAIVLNGAIFGVIHFVPLSMLSLILVGIVLAFLYEKTDSLVAPMIAHSLYNLVVIALSLLAGW